MSNWAKNDAEMFLKIFDKSLIKSINYVLRKPTCIRAYYYDKKMPGSKHYVISEITTVLQNNYLCRMWHIDSFILILMFSLSHRLGCNLHYNITAAVINEKHSFMLYMHSFCEISLKIEIIK